MQTFFCDYQIRKFILQFTRLMSHFQVQFGPDSTGLTTLQQVPVYYGDSSTQVASILFGNSENSLPTVPAIAIYITGLDYDRTRVQEPTHISKLNLREREFNSTTGTWEHNQGNAFTVERLMPSPYKLTIKADVWTSNTNQKWQLWEQIFPLFNPGLEIQSTDNYIDWTSLSTVFLNSTNWSSRTVPTGTGGPTIDVFSGTFEIPIWLSLPAKVKKLGVVQKIINSIYDSTGHLAHDVANLPSTALLAQRVLSPMDYGLIYYNNVLQLFEPTDIIATNSSIDIEMEFTTKAESWKTLIDAYGLTLQNGTSEIRLGQPNGTVVVGTVSYFPSDDTKLLFNPFSNSVPANNLPPINAIIDPFNMPVDSSYINAAAGTRYLILNDIGSADNITAAQAWHGSDGSDLIAKENDIIEFNGTRWFVSFSAADTTDTKYITNLKSGLQFVWSHAEQSWSKAIEGKYDPGEWSIILTTIK